jgi:RimJ/RimL family protein N-acetyltransferase
MTALRLLSAVSPAERDWLAGFIADQPILSLYFEAALEDLARGLDNRLVLIGKRRHGFILGLVFDTMDVLTVYGALDDVELKSVAARPRRAELCVQTQIAESVRAHCTARVANVFGMRVYARATERTPSVDPRARRLTIDDLSATAAFYAAHYPQTVFSAWMLDQPFLALFDADRIIAAAGVLAISRKRRWAIIGNFLTDPAWRGRGLAKSVGRGLISLLKTEGIDHVALVTTDENQAAWRVYEGLGFGLAERWVQIDLKPVN